MQLENYNIASTTLAIAKSYVAAGLGVIPIKANGTKHSAVSWKEYQTRIATEGELSAWFANSDLGIGIVTGAVSGNLEVLDFDDKTALSSFLQGLYAAQLAPLVMRMWHVATPSGGRHIYYRCAETPEGSQKLAMTADNKVRIETRGSGAYVVAPGSPAACHRTGKLYSAIGELRLPVLTGGERQRVLEYARVFNQATVLEVKRQPIISTTVKPSSDTPGNAFNQQASWHELLEPRDWVAVRQMGSQTMWRRPGAQTGGWDAATNNDGTDRLWVWSSNAGLPTNTYLSKYAVYAMLNHGGNFSEATKQLALMGYGKSFARQTA